VPQSLSLRSLVAAALAALLISAVPSAPAEAAARAVYTYGQVVNYPLVFPAAEPHTLGTRSHFWAQRYNGDHHAQDIMADKMTEVYAVASGTVTWIGSSCCSVTITHDDGWKSVYIHLNNDLDPEADDGQGWGIAPGIVRGSRVERGQLIGWVGDSGNAEGTDPHLHFELMAPDPDSGTGYYSGVYVDSFESLKEAEAAQGSSCSGEKATRVDTDGDHRITGTRFDDVIVGTDYSDTVSAGAGDDLVCGGAGDDFLAGGAGDDTLVGGTGEDDLTGGGGDDTLVGHDGDDRLRGGTGNDDLFGGSGRDLLVASPGADHLNGGRGRDTVTFASAPEGVAADLTTGTATGGAAATLVGFETVRGSSHDDALTGDGGRNTLLGLGGADTLAGAAGNDRLLGGAGDDTLLGGDGDDFLDGGDGEADSADGGEGIDTCLAEAPAACEA